MTPKQIKELLLLTGTGLGVVSMIVIKKDKHKKKRIKADQQKAFLPQATAFTANIYSFAQKNDPLLHNFLDLMYEVEQTKINNQFKDIVANYDY